MMISAPQDDGDVSVRINIGLTKICVDEISSLMYNTDMYGGRSEFILAAIRDFRVKIYRKAIREFERAKDFAGNSSNAQMMYENSMAAVGSYILNQFRGEFGNHIDAQISVRIPRLVFNEITRLANEIDCNGVQNFCRMAVYEYIMFMRDVIDDCDSYRELHEEFYSSEPEEDVDIDDYTSDAVRDWKMTSYYDRG